MSIQSLVNFFRKSDFEYDFFNQDLFKYHPQLRIFFALNGIFFNNADSYLRFIWPVLNILVGLVASSMEMMFTYHGINVEDYSFATECFCYFIALNTIPIFFISVLYNRNKLVELLYSMNRDFLYICSLGEKYRNTFLKGQLLIKKLCIFWLGFVVLIILMYFGSMLAKLTYQSLFATLTENTVRPLIFPVWLPKDDPHRTPNYEIFVVIEIINSFIAVQTFGVYVYTLFHILLHYYYLMSMIILDFEVLFDGLDANVGKYCKTDLRRINVECTLNNRIRRIVTWHNLVFQSIKTVSSVYGPLLVYQVLFSSLAICLTAYQVAVSIDHGKFNVIFAMLSVAACLQLWVPCYLGTLIKNKAFAIGDAAWGCGWQNTPLGLIARPYIIFIIMRSQQPVVIKFTGLPNLDLETFSSDKPLKRLDKFKYLGSVLHENGNVESDVKSRVAAPWSKGRELTAVTCDPKVMTTSYSYFNILRHYK